MKVRELQSGEVEVLVSDLWLPFAAEMAELDDYDALADETSVREQAIDYRSKRLEDDQVVTYVVEVPASPGNLIAFAEAERRDPSPIFDRDEECFLHGIYVKPAYRGRGIAAQLLDLVEAWGRDAGCEHVALSVHPDNTAAKAMYDDRGYELKRAKLALEL